MIGLKEEFLDVHLKNVLKFFMENALKKKGWKVVAVDVNKDVVVFSRLEE